MLNSLSTTSGSYGTLSVDTKTGEYTYTADATKVQEAGGVAQETFSLLVTDHKGAFNIKDVTFRAATDDTGNLVVVNGDTSNFVDKNGQAITVQVTDADGKTIILGTGKDDTIDGTEGDDIIYAGAGDDTVNAGDGDDKIFGGAGDDEIDAGAGNDTVYAGEGKDTVYGGTGDDVIDGGEGDDKLFGGEKIVGEATSNDEVDGENNAAAATETDNDTIYGGAGNDFIDGGTGNDQLFGDAGNDILVFDGRDKTINGEQGIDFLVSGSQSNSVDAILSSSESTSVSDVEVVIDGPDTLVASLTDIAAIEKTMGVEITDTSSTFCKYTYKSSVFLKPRNCHPQRENHIIILACLLTE